MDVGRAPVVGLMDPGATFDQEVAPDPNGGATVTARAASTVAHLAAAGTDECPQRDRPDNDVRSEVQLDSAPCPTLHIPHTNACLRLPLNAV